MVIKGDDAGTLVPKRSSRPSRDIRKVHNTQGCAEGTFRSRLVVALVVRDVDGELVVLVVTCKVRGV
jgi:hypothetical protein